MSDLNVYTTSQINALTPITGDMVVDSDLNAIKLYDGAAWRTWNSDSTAVPYYNRWGASFDGSHDYMDFGTNTFINSSSAFSVSAWFDVDNITTNYPTICMLKTNLTKGFVISLDSRLATYKGVWFGSNYNEFRGFATGNSTLSTLISSGWHHLVLTYDGVDPLVSSSFTVYVDGVNYAIGSSSISLGTYANVNYVGKGAYQYEGLIDEFAIFNTELDQADVTKIYNGGVPTSLTSASSYDTDRTANLKGYWRMGDDSSDSPSSDPSSNNIATITDSSGNGNDATQSTASSQPTFSALASSETIYV